MAALNGAFGEAVQKIVWDAPKIVWTIPRTAYSPEIPIHVCSFFVVFFSFFQVVPEVVVIAVIALYFTYRKLSDRTVPVYLVDFSVAKKAEDLCVTKERFVDLLNKQLGFEGDALDFQARVVANTGLGEHTEVPWGTFAFCPCLEKMDVCLDCILLECEGHFLTK